MNDKRKNLDEATLYEVNRQVQSSVSPMTRVIYDLNETVKDHIAKESDRITTIDTRLDRHLEIYANNGKESARVADALETLINQHKEMYDIFQSLKGGKRSTVWVLSGFMLMGSAYLLVKQLLK